MSIVKSSSKKTGKPASSIASPAFESPLNLGSTRLSPGKAAAPPIALAVALLAFSGMNSVWQNASLRASFWLAGLGLLLWAVGLASARPAGRSFTLDVVLRKQHYVQASMQFLVFVYWGWYWPQVYASAHLIAAQLLFAYAFDYLLSWARRDSYTLGFGPFPVIFSINLFLWFREDWFYYQFLMIATGFAAKELIRWNKGGRVTHIFNPSSFPLALFSVVLILTATDDRTWGFLIANTQFYPPYMYVALFLIGLPGQLLFGVTTMTMSAVVTTCLFSVIYFAVTGSYFFFDSYIPIAVFLGMHLLFTDPSTSPRTELGRLMFGALYGLSTVVLYAVLVSAGVPAFYDKLLQVPLLNLSIRALDRLAQSRPLQRFDPAALGRSLMPRQRHLAYVAIWSAIFASMSVTGILDDRHPGQWVPFWQKACAADAPGACNNLAFLEEGFCLDGSGWSCNEFAILQADRLGRDSSVAALQRGCALRFDPACENLARVSVQPPTARGAPRLEDYPIILRGSKGPIIERDPVKLYALACKQGWPDTCGGDRVSREE